MNEAPKEKIATTQQDGSVPRRAIFVLGMHRSGTSAVTRCLNLLGVDLGFNLIPPAEKNNPTGFWESVECVAINEALLSSLHRQWYDPQPLWYSDWAEGRAVHEARQRIVRLVHDEFGGSELWAIKDPRLCHFVPLWREALVGVGVDVSAILVVRHPSEVAGSLTMRDGLPHEAAHLVWLDHCAAAEHATRDMRRSMVVYDDLLTDWRSVLAKVADDLELTWPISPAHAESAITRFLDVNLKHHSAVREPDGTPAVLERLYNACVARASGVSGWEPVSGLVDSYMGKIKPLLTELERVAGLDPASANLDQVSLYFRSPDETFSENRVCRQTCILTSNMSTVCCKLPPGNNCSFLRFDPSPSPGAFEVGGVRIDGVAVRDFATRVGNVNRYRLGRGDRGRVRFVSFDDDPHVEFDLSDVVKANQSIRTIEIDCRRFDLGIVPGSMMMRELGAFRERIESGNQAISAELARLSSAVQEGSQQGAVPKKVLQILQDSHDQATRELAAAREREAGLRRSVSESKVELAQQRVKNDDQKAQIAQLNDLLALASAREGRLFDSGSLMAGNITKLQEEQFAARRRNAALRGQLTALQQECGDLQKRLQGLRLEHSDLEQSNVGLRRDLAGLRQQHVALQHEYSSIQYELHEIRSSTLWRVLVGIRGVLLHLPRWVRLGLRRTLKALWWALTPWRIPKRIEFLRQRKATHRQD